MKQMFEIRQESVTSFVEISDKKYNDAPELNE